MDWEFATFVGSRELYRPPKHWHRITGQGHGSSLRDNWDAQDSFDGNVLTHCTCPVPAASGCAIPDEVRSPVARSATDRVAAMIHQRNM